MFSISVILIVLLLLEFSYVFNNFIMLHDYVSSMFAVKPFGSTSVVLKCAIEMRWPDLILMTVCFLEQKVISYMCLPTVK